MNLCEIGLFHVVWGVSKGTCDIIMKFGKNNVLCPKYIDIYEFWGVWGGRTWPTVHILFIIKKNRKSTRAWRILKSNSTSFWFNFFFMGWIIKTLQKGAQGEIGEKKFLLFLYEVSIVVLIDFIAILLTPGIVLI